MPLVTLAELLRAADKGNYAVGSFNVINLEFLDAILEAADEEESPVILGAAEVHFKYTTLENLIPAVRAAANRARVPVALHLDHGTSFEAVMRALRLGFTSVMFDGSHLPFEENIARTAEVAKMCHALGVSVEAELGHVGGQEGSQAAQEQVPEDLLTRPEQAKEFVERTGCDALAVAIGTIHGLYRKEPKLDFARLAAIRQLVPIPLVLHGGTGLAVEDFHRCIDLGVRKINFFTGMSVAACRSVGALFKSNPNYDTYPELLMEGKKAIKEAVREQIRIFRSSKSCSARLDECGVATACEGRSGPNPPAARAADFATTQNLAEMIADIVRDEIKRLGGR